MLTETDFSFMRAALALAERGMNTTTPNPRVGCVIVGGDSSNLGRIIGQGHTQPAGQAHAEVMALRNARERGEQLRGATVFVTLEPCSHFGRTPPCVHGLIEAGVARVVTAIEDPNPKVAGQGHAALRNAGIDVRCGLLENEAREMNIGFMARMTRGTPWVRLKAAITLDGIMALPNGQSQWITSQLARDDGHQWRARACAVLTGLGTVRNDDPRMTVRALQTTRQPVRVLIDSQLEVPLESQILKGGALIYCGCDCSRAPFAQRAQELVDRGCEVISLPNEQQKVDLRAMLKDLGERQINELHIEAGGSLNGSLLRAGCIDELLIYQAPMFAFQGSTVFQGPTLSSLSQADSWELLRSEPIGVDIRHILRRPKERILALGVSPVL